MIARDGEHARAAIVRRAGLDFRDRRGVLLQAGRRLGPAELALAAAMGHARLPVVRRPRVAILATGDELVAPGRDAGARPDRRSNTFAIAAYVEGAGGEAVDLGIAGDDFAALEAAIARAETQGRRARHARRRLRRRPRPRAIRAHRSEGMQLGFWRIAMRPGKPLILGALGPMAYPGPAGQSGVVDRVRADLPDPAAARAVGRSASRRRTAPSPPSSAPTCQPTTSARIIYAQRFRAMSRAERRDAARDPGLLAAQRLHALAGAAAAPAARAGREGRRGMPRFAAVARRILAPHHLYGRHCEER